MDIPIRPRSSVLLVVLGLFVGISVAGCDTQSRQEDFRNAAEGKVEGFTRTDENGQVISEDPDDWRTAPLYAGAVQFDPAFPNPTNGVRVTIPVHVSDFNAIPGGIQLRGLDPSGNLVSLDESTEASEPGDYILSFEPTLLSSSGDLSSIEGLHRLLVFDQQGHVITYGDLMIHAE